MSHSSNGGSATATAIHARHVDLTGVTRDPEAASPAAAAADAAADAAAADARGGAGGARDSPRHTRRLKRATTLRSEMPLQTQTEDDSEHPIVTAWPEVEEYSFDHFAVSDGIAWLMGHSLKNILAIFVGLFVGLILGFGVLFYFDRGGVSGPREYASFADCVWLSLQTFTTIGYGVLSPRSFYTHVLTAVNSFLGILYTAVLTSVFMAHLMTPKAHWKVSDVMVLHRDLDDPTRRRVVLEGRIVLAPGRIYYDMEARMQLQYYSRHLHGPKKGEIKGALTRDLKLASGSVIVRGSMWFFQHVVDEQSPLYDKIAGDLESVTDLRSITLKVQGKDPRLQSLATVAKIFEPDSIILNDEFQDLVEKRTNDRKEERNVVVASKLSLTKKTQ
jgi:inward rectifier potassium channel